MSTYKWTDIDIYRQMGKNGLRVRKGEKAIIRKKKGYNWNYRNNKAFDPSHGIINRTMG